MKKLIVSAFVFVLFLSLSPNKALALLPSFDDIRDSIQIKLPTATPTPVIFKQIDPNINLKLIVTIAPTIAPTATPTMETKLTVTPEPTVKEISPTMSQTPSIQPSVEATKTVENVENKMDLKSVFVNITLGLLVLIIVIQLWPKKNEK